MTQDPQQVGQAFVREMASCWGDALVAVVLYGSAARKDFVPSRSDYNFLVLVRDLDPARLLSLQRNAKVWRKKRIAPPFFMRPEMVPTALDSYPLEFLTMRGAYCTLLGDDPLADLKIAPADVRLQCERELRGNLLHLRRGAIDCEGRRDRMMQLIRASLPAMTAIFQGLLFLARRPHSFWGTELLDAVRDGLGVDSALFHDLHRVRLEKRPPPKEDLEELLIRYLREVERLMQRVDAGEIGAPAQSQR